MAPAKELPPASGAEQGKPARKRSRFKLYMILGSILLVVGALAGTAYWWVVLRPGAPGLDGLFAPSEETTVAAGAATQQDGSTGATTSEGAVSGSSGTSGSSGASGSPENTPPKALPRPVPLPEVVVNLADPQGSKYLRISMEVEVVTPEAAQELGNQNARVRDAIILLLSGKTAAELTSPEGKVLLKNEVAARLNQILGAPRIARIFFTNFVIQ